VHLSYKDGKKKRLRRKSNYTRRFPSLNLLLFGHEGGEKSGRGKAESENSANWGENLIIKKTAKDRNNYGYTTSSTIPAKRGKEETTRKGGREITDAKIAEISKNGKEGKRSESESLQGGL